MVYMCSPYTNDDPAVREQRFQAACRQVAEMLSCGVFVFSPIVYTHHIAAHGLPLEWPFWERFDRAFLEVCSEVWVLTLDGWRESKGVQAEIALARGMGKPVMLVEPGSLNDQTPVAAACAGVVASEEDGLATS